MAGELEQYGPQGLAGLAGAAVASLLTALGLTKKKATEDNSRGKRLGEVESQVSTLLKLHEERNKGDEFKRGELEQLKTDRTEAKSSIKELERRVRDLEDEMRRRP